jgi:hypothetical protein
MNWHPFRKTKQTAQTAPVERELQGIQKQEAQCVKEEVKEMDAIIKLYGESRSLFHVSAPEYHGILDFRGGHPDRNHNVTQFKSNIKKIIDDLSKLKRMSYWLLVRVQRAIADLKMIGRNELTPSETEFIRDIKYFEEYIKVAIDCCQSLLSIQFTELLGSTTKAGELETGKLLGFYKKLGEILSQMHTAITEFIQQEEKIASAVDQYHANSKV